MQKTDDLANQVKIELLAETIRRSGARVRVTGASMLPAIWPGDVLMVRRQDPTRIVPGDVVLCRCNGGLQAHRVARQCGGYLITRGDALTADDPPVQVADLLGQVTAISRGSAEIPLTPTFRSRLISGVLRHSDWAVMLLLRLFDNGHSSQNGGPAWPS